MSSFPLKNKEELSTNLGDEINPPDILTPIESEQEIREMSTETAISIPDLPDSTLVRNLFNKEISETSFTAKDKETQSIEEVPAATIPIPSFNTTKKKVPSIQDDQGLIAELNLAIKSIKDLDKIDGLNLKIEALNNFNKVLQDHGEVLASLKHLDNLKNLDKLEGLKELSSIQELKKLENLSKLSQLDKIGDLSKLDNLAELKLLGDLSELSSLDKLDNLQRLGDLEKLDSLNNLQLLDKLDDSGFIEKVERLDKISILNKKMHILVFAQIVGVLFEVVKFGCAAALILFIISTQIGRKFTTSALTATGFGSSAQANLGLMLLQGELAEPQFEEIIENVRKRIKADYHRAISIDNRLTLRDRVGLISEVLDYSYEYKDISIQEETRQAVTQQVLYSKNLVVSKIEFDISIARNENRLEDISKLKELKTLFLNKKYPEIIELYKNKLETSESIKMATIVATLEMYLQDPKTLQHLILL